VASLATQDQIRVMIEVLEDKFKETKHVRTASRTLHIYGGWNHEQYALRVRRACTLIISSTRLLHACRVVVPCMHFAYILLVILVSRCVRFSTPLVFLLKKQKQRKRCRKEIMYIEGRTYPANNNYETDIHFLSFNFLYSSIDNISSSQKRVAL